MIFKTQNGQFRVSKLMMKVDFTFLCARDLCSFKNQLYLKENQIISISIVIQTQIKFHKSQLHGPRARTALGREFTLPLRYVHIVPDSETERRRKCTR